MNAPQDLIAWAAGLYDGEGSASMYVPKLRKTARRQMQVSQGGVAGTAPDVLVRFAQVVGDGNITGPYRGYLFYWKTTRKDVIDAVAAALWPYLSAEKRSQFEAMTRAAGRDMPPMPPFQRSPETEVAWAAGLFDGEGNIGLCGAREGRAARLEIPQSSSGGVPDTLGRFRAIVGTGAVNGPYPPRSPWSRLPWFRWSVTGRHQVSSVLGLLWPWLSPVKRRQSRAIGEYLEPGLSTRR